MKILTKIAIAVLAILMLGGCGGLVTPPIDRLSATESRAADPWEPDGTEMEYRALAVYFAAHCIDDWIGQDNPAFCTYFRDLEAYLLDRGEDYIYQMVIDQENSGKDVPNALDIYPDC